MMPFTPGATCLVGMHRFNICLVVVLLWCENTISFATIEKLKVGTIRGLNSGVSGSAVWVSVVPKQ